MQIDNKVVVITGGAQGLGLAMAANLIERGAKIALFDVNSEQLNVATNKLGTNAKSYICNVADENSVIAAVQNVVADFGQIDALVNNAGITRDGLTVKAKDGVISKMSLANWQSVIDINLTGVFLCMREVVAYMLAKQIAGVIVNISSVCRVGNMGQSNYSATKAAVVADTVVWAKELARYGVRVGAVAPGFIATEMVASMKPEALAKVTAGIPLKRLGTPEEVAQAVTFILENDYFTGRCIELDGGLRL